MTRHDAEVFTCRWTIRDKDPALKALLREMQNANSSTTVTSAILRLKHALASRGLLGRASEFAPGDRRHVANPVAFGVRADMAG